MIHYIIPARKGSKGFPLKNRKLFHFTADIIPSSEKKNTIVTTDDEYIYDRAEHYNFIAHQRPKKLAQDKTSTKDVLIDVVNTFDINDDELIVMLYLTFPERKYQDILGDLDFFNKHKANSVLCRVEPKSHPFVCMYADGLRGAQVVEHELYRRQDYPKCLKLSMFVACYKARVVEKLHPLCMENDTIFYNLEQNKVDVDNKTDLDSVYGKV